MDIWTLLEKAATEFGRSIAVVDGDLRLTYEELHARACRLAGSGKISKKVLRAPYWTHYDKQV